jgi:hypothetical protein
MADFSDLFKRSVAAAGASFDPSPELPQRIARRTLQLQRRRRARIVGGAAVLTVAALALPLVINPTLHDSTAVSVPFEPAKTNMVKNPTTTTITAKTALRLPDLSGLSPKERAKAKKKFAAAKKRSDDDSSDDTEVLDAQATRSTSGKTRVAARRSTTTTRRRTTTTTAKPTTTTKAPTPTTTPTTPPPTTPPPTTPPIVPLQIVAPDLICAGVPVEFRATGTGADLVVWSNGQVGAVATFVLTESANVVATLDLSGTHTSREVFAQVTPTGTPPC